MKTIEPAVAVAISEQVTKMRRKHYAELQHIVAADSFLYALVQIQKEMAMVNAANMQFTAEHAIHLLHSLAILSLAEMTKPSAGVQTTVVDIKVNGNGGIEFPADMPDHVRDLLKKAVEGLKKSA